MKKAVFLDKDGTIVENVAYNVDVKRVVFAPGLFEALSSLSEKGYLIIIVSNQSGIARGYFNEEQLKALIGWMKGLLSGKGIRLSGFYFCPHHIGGSVSRYAVDCRCRKPKSGLLEKASRDLGINLSRSWMVGDILNDVEAGRRAGCRTILIKNGNETEWRKGRYRKPDYVAQTLKGALSIILGRSTVTANINTGMPLTGHDEKLTA